MLFMIRLGLLLFLVLNGSVALIAQPTVLPDSLFNIEDSVLIPTRSGFPISAIIARKKSSVNPLPVALFYTTYFQGPGDAIFAKRSAERDYVGILAYARGIRTDLNWYTPFEHEGDDIYDIIEWISKQPWCDGQVGMFGGSYTGFAQWAAMKKIHPALKTIVPQVAVMPGFDFPMENNVPLSHILGWSNDNIYRKSPLNREVYFDYFNTGTAYNRIDSLAGYRNPIFQEWLLHPDYDAYWREKVPGPSDYVNIDIPILSTTGYYDGSQIGALGYYKQHNQYRKNAEHYLVIGPYDHWGGQRRAASNLMGYEIDTVAQINMMDLAYQWIDHILKRKPKPEILRDKVNFQVMGANRWEHVSSLQATSNDSMVFYLDGKTLAGKKPGRPGYQLQEVNFRDRETQHNYYIPSIVMDSLDASNGLVFTSGMFEEDFELNGSFSGRLVATINKKDMDISLALFELKPDGTYFFLTRYVGRASHARDDTRRMLLKPGSKVSIPFTNTRFVSKRIMRGSRLVALLNVNKHPFEIINYGSGKPVSQETILDAGEPLQIRWHNEGFIKIPVRK